MPSVSKEPDLISAITICWSPGSADLTIDVGDVPVMEAYAALVVATDRLWDNIPEGSVTRNGRELEA